MALTKEQLINYFQNLDLATLQKLYSYSELLIIPEEDTLVNVTMSQMVSKAHQLADTLFPEWTDRSKSDFGQFLVELMALFSEKDFWYLNAFANEGILQKMRSYSNAFLKVSSMGYEPQVLRGAEASFSVTFEEGDPQVYQKGDLILSVAGLKFTNPDVISVPDSATPVAVTVPMVQGEQNLEDYTYNGFSIYVRRTGIDFNSVRVIVDNVEFTRVKNFGDSSSSSPHFIVLPEDDSSVSIFFGDGEYGLSLPIGKNVQVYFRLCDGANGNIPVGTATVEDSLPVRGATAATMLSDSTNGGNFETLNSLKQKAPRYFANKRAAINEVVTQQIINELSFVRQSKVTVLNRDVLYQVIPTSGALEPTAGEITQIEELVAPRVMLGYFLVQSPNQYVNLITRAASGATQLILDVLAYKGYSVVTMEAAIRSILSDITNPLISATYGALFDRALLDSKLRSEVRGVQSTVFKVLVGGVETLMGDVQLEPTEIFQVINQSNVTVRINVI